MTDSKQIVTLRCSHIFHGQCICDHLRRDGRCPLCRDTFEERKSADEVASDEVWPDELEDEALLPRLTLQEAFNVGKMASITDNTTMDMLLTYHKCKSEAKTASDEFDALNDRLDPLRLEVEREINVFEQKAYDKFNAKNTDLISKVKDAQAQTCKSRRQMRIAKIRIAKKYGFEDSQRFLESRRNLQGRQRRERNG